MNLYLSKTRAYIYAIRTLYTRFITFLYVYYRTIVLFDIVLLLNHVKYCIRVFVINFFCFLRVCAHRVNTSAPTIAALAGSVLPGIECSVEKNRQYYTLVSVFNKITRSHDKGLFYSYRLKILENITGLLHSAETNVGRTSFDNKINYFIFIIKIITERVFVYRQGHTLQPEDLLRSPKLFRLVLTLSDAFVCFKLVRTVFVYILEILLFPLNTNIRVHREHMSETK